MDAAADGALVADVARRDDITRQHIYQWPSGLRDKGAAVDRAIEFCRGHRVHSLIGRFQDQRLRYRAKRD